MNYVDLNEYGLEFKNIISGPAPVGRILNYIKLAGKGKLKHKNGYRNLDLSNDIGYAWTTEFMFGLGLIYSNEKEESDKVIQLELTSDGNKLFKFIEDNDNIVFDDNNDECKQQVLGIGFDFYNCFKEVFINSVIYKNLQIYIKNHNNSSFNKTTFKDEYYSELYSNYTGKVSERNSEGASTGGNRVPSMIDLCKFFDLANEGKENYYFYGDLTMNKEKDLELKFKKWLLNDKNPKLNNEASADSYISSMKAVYSEFDKYKNYDSIFNISNVNDAEAYFDYITNNRNYKSKYLEKSNYAARSGFSSYIEFLKSDLENKQKYQYTSRDGVNLVIYGTPGCGKSYILDRVLKESVKIEINDLEYNGLALPEDRIIRTTFHHDYSNTDFVGQIVPQVESDGSATYIIKPGPFTKALTKAFQTNENVALVIEELNRGDAAGVLGDIFQLLDRYKDNDGNHIKGVSQYPIENSLIQTYLTEHTDYKFDNIRIPSNLYIFATMNTSDQNVFTLDTAFKRRWDFLKMKNNYIKYDEDCGNEILYVPGSNKKWTDFVKQLNKKMLKLNGQINEDKQLGLYFVDKDLLAKKENEYDEEKTKKFAFKVLEYLWDDVVRYDHTELFDNKIETLDDLVDKFVKLSKDKKESTSVFKDDTFIQNENE